MSKPKSKSKSKAKAKDGEDTEGKEVKKNAILHPAEAAASAFADVNDLDCVNLTRGRRVHDALSSGSLVLDLILGGGFARGRFGTIFGPEASGKSTILQQLVVSAQALGITIVFYDPEAGADPVYMRTQGVDFKYTIPITRNGKKERVPGFFYSQPDTGESVYRHILGTLSRMPDVEEGRPTVLFIIDSFAAMMSEEVDQETGEGARLGSQARMHSFWLGLISPKLRRKGAVLLGSNQMRAAIGSYGNPEKEAGGNALKYYSHYKIRTSRKQVEADKMKVQGLPVIWRTVKNKVFPPFRSTDMRLVLGKGIDIAFDTHYFFTHLGLLDIEKGRRRFRLKGLNDRLYAWPDFRFLTENPKFRARCFEMFKDPSIYERYFLASGEATYFYDKEYDYAEADVAVLEEAVKDEAGEYADEKKASRAKGKRPPTLSKQEEKMARELEEQAVDEAAVAPPSSYIGDPDLFVP